MGTSTVAFGKGGWHWWSVSPRSRDLTSLFQPRSVAVVGASPKPASVGGAVFKNLLAAGFHGPVYPVNRGAFVVQSVRAYPSLEALPEVPDLVVIVVPAREVLGVVENAARLGVRAACVISAGFAEAGPEGRALEQEVVRVARGGGLPLLGPNCLGLQNPNPDVRLDATFASTFAPDGPVAFASQSGALGLAALDYARELGIGFSAFASLGNKADLSGNDLLEYFGDDPRTRVILLYLESIGNPARFREIAERVGRTKPVALVKSGRSHAGARAATSHTGALVGSESALVALCEQTGILRVDTLEELFDVAIVLSNQPLPRGRRVAVVTNAGGPGILAADALEAAGLEVPELSEISKGELRRLLRPEASLQNPVDVLADASPRTYGAALAQLLGDPGIDSVMALYVPPATQTAEAVAEAIFAASTGSTKPIVCCLMGRHGISAAVRHLARGHVPNFRFPEGAARALARVVAYAEWKFAPRSTPQVVPPAPSAATEVLTSARQRLGADGGWLSGEEAGRLLAAWGLPLPEERRVRPVVEEAVAASEEVGFPVVMKAEIAGVSHKTEAGAVTLDLNNSDDVRHAAAKLVKLGPTCLLVQRQVTGGEEWLVGAVRVPGAGPLVAVGTGGVRAELWQDVAQRLAPLTPEDLAYLLEKPILGRTLGGWRGGPPGDADAFRAFVSRWAAMAVAHPEVIEIEANPVRVLPKGFGVVALDVRVRLGSQALLGSEVGE